MTETTPITIGMPVYNAQSHLAEAIESIIAQTFTDYTLVISDNGSTDSTGDIVRSYAEQDKRIRYLRHEENHGAAWNFNRVFAECRTPYFKWAASDDLLAPTCVERSYALMVDAPPETVVLVAPQTRWIGADGEFLREGDDRMRITATTPHARLRHVVQNVVWGNTLFGLMVSDALRRSRGLGNYPSSDWVLLAELSLLGQFWVVPEPLFLRREHEAMSRRTNATTLELAQWHDPSNVKPQKEMRRVFVELLGAIKHAPISNAEKSLCYGFMLPAWTRRHAPVPAPVRSFVRSRRR